MPNKRRKREQRRESKKSRRGKSDSKGEYLSNAALAAAYGVALKDMTSIRIRRKKTGDDSSEDSFLAPHPNRSELIKRRKTSISRRKTINIRMETASNTSSIISPYPTPTPTSDENDRITDIRNFRRWKINPHPSTDILYKSHDEKDGGATSSSSSNGSGTVPMAYDDIRVVRTDEMGVDHLQRGTKKPRKRIKERLERRRSLEGGSIEMVDFDNLLTVRMDGEEKRMRIVQPEDVVHLSPLSPAEDDDDSSLAPLVLSASKSKSRARENKSSGHARTHTLSVSTGRDGGFLSSGSHRRGKSRSHSEQIVRGRGSGKSGKGHTQGQRSISTFVFPDPSSPSDSFSENENEISSLSPSEKSVHYMENDFDKDEKKEGKKDDKKSEQVVVSDEGVRDGAASPFDETTPMDETPISTFQEFMSPIVEETSIKQDLMTPSMRLATALPGGIRVAPRSRASASSTISNTSIKSHASTKSSSHTTPVTIHEGKEMEEIQNLFGENALNLEVGDEKEREESKEAGTPMRITFDTLSEDSKENEPSPSNSEDGESMSSYEPRTTLTGTDV